MIDCMGVGDDPTIGCLPEYRFQTAVGTFSLRIISPQHYCRHRQMEAGQHHLR